MSKPPAPELAIFHAGNLPAHHSNPHTDAVVDWPRSPSGVEFMPMSGRFRVQTEENGVMADVVVDDGFLIHDAGTVRWVPEQPI